MKASNVFYRETAHDWELQYSEDLTEDQKKRIAEVLTAGAKELGLWEEKPAGDIIEDRGSQITYSSLGQDIVDELGEEGVHIKEAWDPDSTKKMKIRDIVAKKIPNFEVRAAGATSIDVTLPGRRPTLGHRHPLTRPPHATGHARTPACRRAGSVPAPYRSG